MPLLLEPLDHLTDHHHLEPTDQEPEPPPLELPPLELPLLVLLLLELLVQAANTEAQPTELLVPHTEPQAASPALNQVPHTDKELPAAFPPQLVANLEPVTLLQATKEPPELDLAAQVQEPQGQPTTSRLKDLESV